MPHNSPEVRFIPRADGTHDVAILVKNVRMRRNETGTGWSIIDHEGLLQEKITCGNLTLRPKFILKLYCQAPRRAWPEIQHRMMLDELRHKEPSLRYSL